MDHGASLHTHPLPVVDLGQQEGLLGVGHSAATSAGTGSGNFSQVTELHVEIHKIKILNGGCVVLLSKCAIVNSIDCILPAKWIVNMLQK